jgi:putative selenium metabolism hydrolase
MLSEQRLKYLTDLCAELVRIKSCSGEEKQVIGYLENLFKKSGCPDILIDEYGSLTARFAGKRAGNTILFDSHVDTVPVTDQDAWASEPFGGKITDNRIYGRGTADMKGALAAVIVAVQSYLEDHGNDFPGQIVISAGVHEESFEGIASRRISRRVNPDIVVICEATNLNLARGQRGRAEIVMETFGKPAHSSNPQAGINAVYNMMNLLNAVRSLRVSEHPVLGRGILELTDIKSSPYPGLSVVPACCRCTFDRRLLVNETEGTVLQPIRTLIDELQAGNPDFKARAVYAEGTETCYTGEMISARRFFPGWLYDETESFIRSALTGLQSAGLDPDITTYSFCTNGSHYAGEAGIKTIGFGPSAEQQAHINDEYIEIYQLQQACRGYYGMLAPLLIDA